jgi:hypothetical protein
MVNLRRPRRLAEGAMTCILKAAAEKMTPGPPKKFDGLESGPAAAPLLEGRVYFREAIAVARQRLPAPSQ